MWLLPLNISTVYTLQIAEVKEINFIILQKNLEERITFK